MSDIKVKTIDGVIRSAVQGANRLGQMSGVDFALSLMRAIAAGSGSLEEAITAVEKARVSMTKESQEAKD